MNNLVTIGAGLLVMVVMYVHAMPTAEEVDAAHEEETAHKISKRSGFGYPGRGVYPGQIYPRPGIGNPIFPQIPGTNTQIQTSKIVLPSNLGGHFPHRGLRGNNPFRQFGNNYFPGHPYNRFPLGGNYFPNYNRGYNYGGAY